MKYTYLIIISLCTIFLTKCNNSTPQADFPPLWKEQKVPTMPNSILEDTKFEENGRRNEWTAIESSNKSFDEIYEFFIIAFEKNGWKQKIKSRSDEGEDSESIVLVHTKGPFKHTTVVTKGTINTQKIRSSIVKYNPKK